MNNSNFFINTEGTEWTLILFYLVLLTGLFFVQKYMYVFDRKLAEFSKKTVPKKTKPWPLYLGIMLGLLSFLYSMFTKNDLALTFSFKNILHVVFLFIILISIAGILVESIVLFGTKTGFIRSFIYLLLMILYFYTGFITGLFFVSALALAILIYIFFYFKKLFT